MRATSRVCQRSAKSHGGATECISALSERAANRLDHALSAMPDTFPSRRRLMVGVVAIALLATLGSLAVRTRAAEECRSAVSQATTPYRAEKVLRSATCQEARRDTAGL